MKTNPLKCAFLMCGRSVLPVTGTCVQRSLRGKRALKHFAAQLPAGAEESGSPAVHSRNDRNHKLEFALWAQTFQHAPATAGPLSLSFIELKVFLPEMAGGKVVPRAQARDRSAGTTR